ncbi:Type II secretion system protein N [Bordetella sputigena]|uniref:type II secretion system protein N n=1 Tax=Bordetella sputigena TaxID=1416810 RepID=UPI0039EEFBC2
MKPRRWLLPAAAVCVALVAALAVLPARWLLRAFPTDGPITVVDAAGSIWNGQAQVAIGAPGLRRTLPEPFSWRWHWVSGIGPAAQLAHPWLATPVEMAPGPHGIRMGQGRLTLPADALTAIGAPLNTLEPGGQLALAWPALELGALPPAASPLQLTWTQASSARVRVQPLGDYQASLSADAQGRPDLRIRTLRGALRLDGHGQDQSGRWRFVGQAGPAPDTDTATRDALEPLLSALGSYRNGVSQLRFP